MNEPTKRDREVFKAATLAALNCDRDWEGFHAIDDVKAGASVIAAYREELLAASAQSAEPQEAEEVLRRYIKGNSPIDWDRIKPLIDAYADARLASKPSREEEMRALLAEIDNWITEYNMHWRSYSVSERLKLLNRLAEIQDKARAALAQGGARDERKGQINSK